MDKQTLINGLNLRHQGKVRDSYNLPGHPDMMLPVASDRCSVFDFVLNTLIPFKGEVLTAMSCFWIEEIISQIQATDLVAFGSKIDPYLPEELRGNPSLQKRATVVKLLEQPEVEDIVRLYLTGSGYESYAKTGMICGHKLPAGLIDGSKLPYPIYTPTTKAMEGHDEHIDADGVVSRYGFKRERLSLQIAQAMGSYAEHCGIILADTKFEFSSVLADEKGTPDSSRFWDLKAWKKAHVQGKLPPSFDKQFVREWAKKVLIQKDKDGRTRDTENPFDLEYVAAQV
ncbi:MAG TPA: phosphoribosylaminoimidazolesuccinocarboxamide synthase, partial [Candidatus Nanoarchaeia archaeon]|nr:phosphoribosylaminoimidazolesuccinocarboxamide synthase [Candidatus Nanoarchaeia archaeon]